MNHLLSAKDLGFRYDKEPVVSGVNFELSSGEIIGIIGPNGGGKTTLLRLFMGLLEPTEGSIERSFCRIGYVPQSEQSDHHFPISVLEVVLMGDLSSLGWLGGYPKEAYHRAEELLFAVGLKEMVSRPFSALSGGERQRVLFARALMSDPDILFLDEPTASCDADSQHILFKQIDQMRTKRAVLMVTHDLDRAIEYFDRVISVNRLIQVFDRGAVCEHFALGLYHAPLEGSKCFRKGKKGQ